MKKTLQVILLVGLFIFIPNIYAQTYLINESFEGTFPPDGWTNNGFIQSSNNPRTGTKTLAANGANDAIYTLLLTNPETLSFWYKRSSNTTAWTLKVQTSTDATNWTDRGTISNATTTYQNFTLDLTSFSNIYVNYLTNGHQVHMSGILMILQ